MSSAPSHARHDSAASSGAPSTTQAGPSSPRRYTVPASPSSSIAASPARPANNSRRSRARVPALVVFDSNFGDAAPATHQRTASGATSGTEVQIEMEENVRTSSGRVLFEAPDEERKSGARRRSGESESGRGRVDKEEEEDEEERLEQLGYGAPMLNPAYGGGVPSPAWSIPLSSNPATPRRLEEGQAHQAKLDFEPITRREKAWMWSSAVVVLLLFAVAISISKDWIDWPGDGIGKL